MSAAPLLVTGLPRSGTSWTGKMLEGSGQVVYINEPMNTRRPPGRSPGVLNAKVQHRFQYIDPADDAEWAAAFGDTLRLRFHPLAELRSVRHPYDLARGVKYATQFTVGALRHRRAMLDDPNALFSARWLTLRMGVQTLILVRDPVGLLGSWKALDWKVRLTHWQAQPALMRDVLAPWADQIQHAVDHGDWIEQMCCLWNVAHEVIDRVRNEVDNVLIRRYEDLASDPMQQFAGVYEWFGLDWSDDAQRVVREATSSSTSTKRGFSWSGLSRTAYQRMDSRTAVAKAEQRLTPDEIERVRSLTGDVAARFARTTS
jgi:Sulfotransferase domain